MGTPFDFDQLSSTHLAIITCACMSIVGSFCMIISYWYFKEGRSQTATYIFLLAVCDLGSSLPFLITENDGPWCIIQGVSMNFFQLTSIFWTVIIVRVMYEVTFLRVNIDDTTPMNRYFAFVYGMSSVLSLLPFTIDGYGDTGSWCWITQSSKEANEGLFATPGVWFRFICFFFPLWISIGYIIYMTYLIEKKLKNLVENSTDDEHVFSQNVRGLIRRLRWYPRVLLIGHLPATLLRVCTLFPGVVSIYVLELLAGIFQNLIGFGDFLVFGYSFEMWKAKVGRFFSTDQEAGPFVGYRNPMTSTNSQSTSIKPKASSMNSLSGGENQEHESGVEMEAGKMSKHVSLVSQSSFRNSTDLQTYFNSLRSSSSFNVNK